MSTYTAHDIAADPDLYSSVVWFGKSRIGWECMGYSASGETIRFARLEMVDTEHVKQINKYVLPDTMVYIRS